MTRLSKTTLYNIAGLILAFLGTSALLLSKYEQVARAQYLETEQRCVVMETAAIRELCQRAIGDPDFQQEALQDELSTWISPIEDQTIQIVKLSGAKLLAQLPKPEDQSLPRRLHKDEKDIFDQANRLKTARLVNAEEEQARKFEIETEFPKPSRLSVAVPVEKGQKTYGMILNTKPVNSFQMLSSYLDVSWPLAVGILIFLAGAMFFGKAKGFNSRIGQTILSLLLLAGMVFFWVSQLEHHLATRAQSQVELLQQAHLHGKSILNDPYTSSAIDLDQFQVDRGLLNADSTIPDDRMQAYLQAPLTEAGHLNITFFVIGVLIILFFTTGTAIRFVQTVRTHKYAYLYISPAIIAMLVLVFFPFLFGISLSFTDANIYNSNLPLSEVWTGLDNFKRILFDFSVFTTAADGTTLFNYENFYWTLYITIMWTVCNVTIGVSVGLLLALILNTKGLKMRTVYRVLLILPWAIPNYITALIWNGMFHKQFGVINQMLLMIGMQPVAWFDGVFTSFLTGIATNGWLSFPFMMVICLGGLQSIPANMYEAAKLDGASRWQQFRFITLPSLKSVLIPAIIISVVWTFNMFNIIFLVSGGQPGGANEILITKAYKIAFEQYQYGYAAAYSTVIFGILLIYGIFQMKMSKATEANT